MFSRCTALPIGTTTWPSGSVNARWGCSDGLIYKLIRSGDLHCFRPGVLIRIPVAEVERYECLASNENTPSSDSGEGSPLSGESETTQGGPSGANAVNATVASV